MNLEDKFLNAAAADLVPEEGSPEFRGPVPPAEKLEAPVGEYVLTPDTPEAAASVAARVASGRGTAASVVGQQVPATQPAQATSSMPTDRVFPEDTASIQNIPRNTLQEIMGTIGSAIQSGAEVIDFDVIGLPDVGTLTLKDLTVGDLGKVMEAMSYGFTPTTGAGETLRPTPEALDLLNAIPAFKAASSALKYGARELAPAAANVIESGLRKSGMIMDIVPDGKSVAQQAAKSDIGFYSAVENAAINVQRKSGTGQSFLNDIMKGENVKAEEIKWMGLDEFLKGKKNVTKQEVQDYIANNKVDVQEVALGEKQKPFIDTENAIEYIAKEYNMTPSEVRAHWAYTDENDYVDLANQSIPNAKTRFDTYTLAGGENYREILLTMPNAKQGNLDKATATSNGNVWNVKFDNGQESTFSVNKANDVNEAINYAQQKLGMSYKSSHFDQPNILAHLRVNDRVDSDGKKMLLIEEVQSDWHQAGRNKGYKQNLSQYDVKNLLNNEGYDVDYNGINWVVKSKTGGAVPNKLVGNESNYQFAGDLNQVAAMVLGRQDLMPYTGLGIGAVPDAPFKDTWYQLALKRALQYAAENGYERVGLTTGKQQVDRFNLSKQLSRVSYQDGVLQGYDLSGALVMNKLVDPKDLPNYVGKELAPKMVENAAKDSEIRKKISSAKYNKAPESEINALRSQLDETKTDYSGLDLEVGGEGMKKYYDEIYPKFLEKYGKKWNAKMGETKIRIQSDKQAQEDLNLLEELGQDRSKFSSSGMASVRYIDITSDMKAGVKKGQPLFAAAPIGAATGTAAMQDERKK